MCSNIWQRMTMSPTLSLACNWLSRRCTHWIGWLWQISILNPNVSCSIACSTLVKYSRKSWTISRRDVSAQIMSKRVLH
jgi:hypothetical protein